MNTAPFVVAGRYLAAARKGSIRRIRGAIIAVALSLVPLIVVMEVSEAMIRGITARYLELGTYHLQIVSFSDLREKELLASAEDLAAEPGVLLVVPERQGLGLAYSRTGKTGATIRAVPPDLWERDEGLRRYMEVREGVFDLSGPDAAVIGTELASRLGIGVGDTVKVLTVRTLNGEGLVPRVTTFTVRGVVSTGYQELDKLWMYIPLDRGERILTRETSRRITGIKLEDPFGGIEAARETFGRLLPSGLRLYTWYELEKAQYMSFTTTKYLLLFIMALILAVAAVTISSALVMLQIEKREEIAILKSLGMGPRDISLVFLTVGFVVGLAGTFLGVAAGLAISVSINEIIAGLERLVNFLALAVRTLFFLPGGGGITLLDPQFYLEYIPVRIDFFEVAAAAAFSLLLSLLASYLPSRGAGRVKPLEVLRRH
jgi:lipoprotein-releasing system permease protein